MSANWKDIFKSFYYQTDFPNILGAIDYNYKKNFNIVFMAACDENYAFAFVDVCFRRRSFGKNRINHQLDIPNPDILPYLYL